MKIKVLILFSLLFGLVQIVSAQEVSNLIKDQNERGYLVGPGDTITVKVLNEEQFNFETKVDEDGNIQVPFFDKQVFAKCRTEKELDADITQLLAKYIRSPMASVNVKERNSRPLAVIYGAVREQQRVDLKNKKARLLELIAFSGGATENASGTVQVFHTQAPLCADEEEKADWMTIAEEGQNSPPRLYSLNSLRQGNGEANPVIYPGDIIVVMEALPVFVIGQVNATGKLLLPEGGLPLTEALARVGGVRERAKEKDIKIYRQRTNSTEREIISVNLKDIKLGKQKDVMLEPYDIVEVDKEKKGFLEVVLDLATGGAQAAVNTLPIRVL